MKPDRRLEQPGRRVTRKAVLVNLDTSDVSTLRLEPCWGSNPMWARGPWFWIDYTLGYWRKEDFWRNRRGCTGPYRCEGDAYRDLVRLLERRGEQAQAARVVRHFRLAHVGDTSAVVPAAAPQGTGSEVVSALEEKQGWQRAR